MRAEFISMEPIPGFLEKATIDSPDQMLLLLEGLRPVKPFFFELLGAQGCSLTVGLARDFGSVQFASADGEPPYLVALAQSGPQTDADDFEFMCGGTATPVSSKYIVCFDLLKKIVVHFLQTGERYPDVSWKEI